MPLCRIKETFAFSILIKHSSLCVQNVECTILCYHREHDIFFKGMTGNTKIKNWSVIISSYGLKMEYIEGTKTSYQTASPD